MMRSFFACWLGLIASCAPTATQAPVRPPEPPPTPTAPTVETWRFTDPQPVTALAPSQGVLWVGSDRGVLGLGLDSKDPRRVQGRPAAPVHAVAVGEGGHLWVGGDSGLFCQREGSERLSEVPLAGSTAAPIRALLAHGGQIWIGGDAGAWVAEGPDEVRELVRDARIVGVVAGPKGVVYAGSRRRGVFKLTLEGAEEFGEDHGLATPGVAGLASSPAGHVVAWAGETLSVFDGARWFPYRLEQPGVRWDIRLAAPDSKGWVVLTQFGFRRLRKAKLPADPLQAQGVLEVIGRSWPHVTPLDIRPAVAATEAPTPRIAKGLPALPPLDPPEEDVERARFDTLRGEAEQAREAFQQAQAERTMRQQEIEVLSAERPDEGEAARTLAVKLDVKRQRLVEAAEEAAGWRDDALFAEARWVAMHRLGARAPLAAMKREIDAVLKSLQEEGEEPAPEVGRAPVSDRAGVPTPRFVLADAPRLTDLSPALLTRVRGDAGGVWIGTRHAGVVHVAAEGGRTPWVGGGLAPVSALGGPVSDAEGQVWVLGGDTVYRFDGRDWVEEAPHPGATYVALATDEAGRVAVLSREGGSYRLQVRGADDAPWSKMFDWAESPEGAQIRVVAMAVTRDGSAWIAAETAGVRSGGARPEGVLVLGPDGTATNHRFDPDASLLGSRGGARLPTDRVIGIAIRGRTVRLATDGGLCALTLPSPASADDKATQPEGVSEGPSAERVVRTVGENEGMDSEVVRAVTIDAEGQTWVATGAGVGRVDTEKRRFVDHSKGLPTRDVRAMSAGPDGAVWALVGEEVYRRPRGGAWTPWPLVAPAGDGPTLGLHVDARNRIWARTAASLLMKRYAGTGADESATMPKPSP